MGASNFVLLEHGSGMKMLEQAVILQNDGMLDVEALERYLTEVLGGVVDQKYAEVALNIAFTEGESELPPVGENGENEEGGDAPKDEDDALGGGDSTLRIVCGTLGVTLALIVAVLIVRKIRLSKSGR